MYDKTYDNLLTINKIDRYLGVSMIINNPYEFILHKYIKLCINIIIYHV